MDMIRAVLVDPDREDRLVISDVAAPVPRPDEALVRVHAISLNRGEVRRAHTLNPKGFRPGCDLSGVVEVAAADGSGPKRGSRVVGVKPNGAWADLACVPTHSLAALPANVSFVQAATLPVAGLTALHALARGGLLLRRSVLVTGVTGGVGNFACQLASNSGARTVALVRSAAQEAIAKTLGADRVAVGDGAAAAESHGPFDLILESIGGASLGAALTMLKPCGTCVIFGASAGAQVSFDAARFFNQKGVTVYGLQLFHELGRETASIGLARLVDLVDRGELSPRVDVEEPFANIAGVARRLLNRQFLGKGVLTL